ncbi:MAG: NAD(+)/NADH kinase [Sphaerobacteraceae bacterium]|nr:MAG: NAD(+)/NADH kinase [Sphaerobacteraceae bacterium]
MTMRIGLVCARSKDEAQELGVDVAKWLSEQSCTVVPEDELQTDPSTVDVLVALGGDGLIMRMAHTYPNTPLLGINVGKVGFMAMIERDDWKRALDLLISGSSRIQSGPTLSARLLRGDDEQFSGWAVNDVVLRSGSSMVDIEVYIDRQFVNTYPGDGMIVATPQGSTAYCMAAGGPALGAGVRGFAVVPICPHSPIRTNIVVPESAKIELVIVNDSPCDLLLDGTADGELHKGDIIQISAASAEFQLVMVEGTDFYQTFRSKFNYMIRPQAVPSLGTDR